MPGYVCTLYSLASYADPQLSYAGTVCTSTRDRGLVIGHITLNPQKDRQKLESKIAGSTG